MGCWSTGAQMRAVERQRDAGARLQHRKAVPGTERARGRRWPGLRAATPPRGARRPECPRQPPAEGSPPLSIARQCTGRSWQIEQRQLPAALPWQPFPCTLSSLFQRASSPLRCSGCCPCPFVAPNQPCQVVTSPSSGHRLPVPALSFSFVKRTELYLDTKHPPGTEGSDASS